ncbi:MAG: radical SAM family heme chaperone HemW, partial [Alphaproteobacteria bacterium]|nr:radical SAM family heme chaperone HemW [Alphaproteobacteria bacterium]
MKPLSLYIHYPFCKSKCPYCDFNSHVRESVDHTKFLRAYEKELEFFSGKIGKRKITTIFFGGGTPSLMPIFLVEGILKKISELWEVSKDCEISLEANPTSSEASGFRALRDIGINRLSLGIQALNDEDLKFLGREHNTGEAIKTIETAAKIFDNFSFDLIYARPEQRLVDWSHELAQALSFGSKHLSLYQLTIEKGTKFFAEFQKKKFLMPEENLAAEFYEITNEITSGAGLELYEISNYTQKNFECRHNLAYWRSEDYLGIGAGAHSRVYFSGETQRTAIT